MLGFVLLIIIYFTRLESLSSSPSIRPAVPLGRGSATRPPARLPVRPFPARSDRPDAVLGGQPRTDRERLSRRERDETREPVCSRATSAVRDGKYGRAGVAFVIDYYLPTTYVRD